MSGGELHSTDSETADQYIAHYRQVDGVIQSVPEHLKQTAELASSFAGKIGLPSSGSILGLLHDLGKYSTDFQEYIKLNEGLFSPQDTVKSRPQKGHIDHATAGAQYLYSQINDQKNPVRLILAQVLALCLASHHGGLIDCITPDGADAFTKRINKSAADTHADEASQRLDAQIATQIDNLLRAGKLEQELQEWLDSLHGEPSQEIFTLKMGLLVRFLFSALVDADRLDTADFANRSVARQRYYGRYPSWDILVKIFEANLAGFTEKSRVNKIRREIAAACRKCADRERGLYLLTVPTGGGKTLAGLRFALHHAQKHKMDRIIYVGPYTSIIDQNARVAREIYAFLAQSGRQIVLEHHSNLTPENDTEQNALLAEDWDAPLVFTTAVQFLAALFGNGTRTVRRMHQLAHAVIIFDEVQTIPIQAVHLFNNAVNFLVGQCGSTVVFCTATQPLLDKVDAHRGAARLSNPAQMIPDVDRLFQDLHRVKIIDKRKSGGWADEEIADAALAEMKEAGSTLIVVNTKAHARALYKLCYTATADVFHLSTSMCPAHRMAILDKIRDRLSRQQPVLCVSTQLIEAGVDVDFGAVIRSLAGLDSIVQAAGRCNRNGRNAEGRVLIVNSVNENLSRLKEIKTAQEITERVLDEFKRDPAAFQHDLLSPAAMSRFYEYYFFARSHEMTYPVSSNDIGRDDTLLSLLSTNAQSVEAYKHAVKAAPPFVLRQSFKSAAEAFKVIDAPTEGVIVPYGDEGKQIIIALSATASLDEKNKLLKRAQRYSVNLFPHELAKLREMHALYQPWGVDSITYLDEQYYSDEFGVSLKPVSPMASFIA